MLTAVVTTNAVRDSVFKRDVHRHKHSSPTRTESRSRPAPYGVQRSTSSHTPLVRTGSKNCCEHGSLPMLSAGGRHWHHRQQVDERSKCLRSSLTCEASAASLRTHASFVSPLRLSGEPPDSRRGGTVTFHPPRRASCEGARESRGSHAASLNEGLTGCMCRKLHSWSWDFCSERSHKVFL